MVFPVFIGRNTLNKKEQNPFTPMVGKVTTRLWLLGGVSGDGSSCGLACSCSTYAWSYARSNVSARHTFNGRNNQNLGCKYCVMGKHPVVMSLGSRSRMYSLCGRNNIHLARNASVRPSVVLVNQL